MALFCCVFVFSKFTASFSALEAFTSCFTGAGLEGAGLAGAGFTCSGFSATGSGFFSGIAGFASSFVAAGGALSNLSGRPTMSTRTACEKSICSGVKKAAFKAKNARIRACKAKEIPKPRGNCSSFSVSSSNSGFTCL